MPLSEGKYSLHRRDIFFGLLIVVLGLIFLLQNLFPDIHIWRFIGRLWPLILIVLGLFVIFGRRNYGHGFHDYLSREGSVFGDMNLQYSGREIGDSTTSQVVGDLTIDLRGAMLKPGVNHLNVSAVIGDTKIIVPKEFPLKVTSKAVVGDLRFDNRTEEGLTPKIDHTDESYEAADRKLWISFSGVIGDMNLERA